MFDSPWKISNRIFSLLIHPPVRVMFALNGIMWGAGWRFYGFPVIQKHHHSIMRFGSNLSLRSSLRSNPLGLNHPVILCTWQAGAIIQTGDYFAMTGGSICAAEQIIIGDRVNIGANTTILDTNFHPIDAVTRRLHPQEATSRPVIIGNDVFIGMNCLILKGVRIGQGSVIGAGSVVANNVPSHVIVAGNPATIVREILH